MLPASNITTNDNGKYQPDLEAYEGMLVVFNDVLTITELYNLARFNEIKLVAGPRPYTYTQLHAPNVTGYEDHLKDIGSRIITYDDGLSLQNQLICHLDGFGDSGPCQAGAFDTSTGIRMGDTSKLYHAVGFFLWLALINISFTSL